MEAPKENKHSKYPMQGITLPPADLRLMSLASGMTLFRSTFMVPSVSVPATDTMAPESATAGKRTSPLALDLTEMVKVGDACCVMEPT